MPPASLVLFVASCTPPPEVTVETPEWSGGAFEPQLRFVVIADPHVTTPDGENAARLERAVDWVNTNADAETLDFVLVVGDIAWGDGFDAARGALDSLTIPYVPINGDNEVQFGSDGTFDTVFAEQYAMLATTFDDWELAPAAVHDLDADRDTWFHNLAFTYGGVRFIGLDWASRHLGGPESELGVLHDYAGGTMPFFRAQLEGTTARRPRESVVLFSHIPMHLGGFNLADADTLASTIAPFGESVWADLAGHYHFDGEESVNPGGYDVIVTDATWDDEVEVRVVTGVANEETFSWRTEIVVVP